MLSKAASQLGGLRLRESERTHVVLEDEIAAKDARAKQPVAPTAMVEHDPRTVEAVHAHLLEPPTPRASGATQVETNGGACLIGLLGG